MKKEIQPTYKEILAAYSEAVRDYPNMTFRDFVEGREPVPWIKRKNDDEDPEDS